MFHFQLSEILPIVFSKLLLLCRKNVLRYLREKILLNKISVDDNTFG